MEGVVKHNLIYVKFGTFTGIQMVYWKGHWKTSFTFLSIEKEWPKKCSPAEENKPGSEVHYKCIPVSSFTVPSSII